jgi:hypothetical protein
MDDPVVTQYSSLRAGIACYRPVKCQPQGRGRVRQQAGLGSALSRFKKSLVGGRMALPQPLDDAGRGV